jgi:hypothetical protein
MTSGERDAFLAEQRSCRVATSGPDGPHVTPLWFVWDGDRLWLHSVVRSQRWTDLERDPRVGAVIDTGDTYDQLRGVELRGTAEAVGQVPRTSGHDPAVAEAEQRFVDKYFGGADMVFDGLHGWLCVTPTKIVSWDFRKLARS